MRTSRMVAWACSIGLGLSLAGGLMGLVAEVGPDSVGNTILGQITGVLSIYHMWAWAAITPLEDWLPPPRGPGLDIGLLLLLPAVDWACLVFAAFMVVGRFRGRADSGDTGRFRGHHI